MLHESSPNGKRQLRIESAKLWRLPLNLSSRWTRHPGSPHWGNAPPGLSLESSNVSPFCVLNRSEQDHLVFYTLDSLRGLGKEVARTEGPTGQSPWSISPAGTRIAIALKNGVRILDLANRTERNLKLPRRIWSLGWAPDDNALFAAVQSADYLLVRIGLDDQTSVLLDRGRKQWLAYAWPSPDGRYLAFSQQSFDSNVWLLEDF